MIVICVNAKYLRSKIDNTLNDHKPQLVEGKEYEVKEIIHDKEGNPHYDVGLESFLNYVRSIETGEELPRGNKIHWCHPSRFEEVIK